MDYNTETVFHKLTVTCGWPIQFMFIGSQHYQSPLKTCSNIFYICNFLHVDNGHQFHHCMKQFFNMKILNGHSTIHKYQTLLYYEIWEKLIITKNFNILTIQKCVHEWYIYNYICTEHINTKTWLTNI